MDDSMIGKWLSESSTANTISQSLSKPMLRQFLDHDKPITYLEKIAIGTEGIIYRVEIAGYEYVLKVFQHWTYRGRIELDESEQPYTFPFSHECRAFARLDSLGQNGTWAVKCHGWMKLSDEQFNCLREYDHVYSRWAIVKDYIPNPIHISDVPDIRSKMRIARKARLHPTDLKPENFRGSFFVDLGEVRTHPYPKKLWSNYLRRRAFVGFDESARSWEVSIKDGSVICGWLNGEYKRNIAQAQAREVERSRERMPEIPDENAKKMDCITPLYGGYIATYG
ncbi:hypothetical protein FQN54_001201 [Arachnomyces sp. PD_36]|nr:hypothetical protein FQN54_001201 [Arachnomyces sp. PD_36]